MVREGPTGESAQFDGGGESGGGGRRGVLYWATNPAGLATMLQGQLDKFRGRTLLGAGEGALTRSTVRPYIPLRGVGGTIIDL